VAALICGSIAYDNIMVFEGKFQDHILPDQIHILNVAFLVPDLRREFGGCAGNIAWNLQMLGGDPRIMATVGEDFDGYRERLVAAGISLEHVTEVAGTLTAQAYITTDLDDNQITAFHPGAMDHSHVNVVPAESGITVGIVAPDGRAGMVDHSEQLSAAGIPFVFDPGQGLPMFDGDELQGFIERATWIAVNDYEGKLLMERTGWDEAAISDRVEALIVTRGSRGSHIFADGQCHEIPAVEAASVQDPTGCGDAYRAGILHGIEKGYPWPDTGRLAALLGSLKVASRGTQNHRFTRQEIASDFEAAFGYSIDI
jgi:adenosine kinase